MAKSRWGRVFGNAVGAAGSVPVFALTPAAVVAGAVSAAKGGSFTDTANAVVAPVIAKVEGAIERAEEFGDEHAEQLTSGAKHAGRVAADAAIGGIIGSRFKK